MTTKVVDPKTRTERYIGAIEARIEGLILDLDSVIVDSHEDHVIQTRLDDLSRLHTDINMFDNPDRAEAVIENRISQIEELDHPDQDQARRRIADLIYLKDVLTGQDPQ